MIVHIFIGNSKDQKGARGFSLKIKAWKNKQAVDKNIFKMCMDTILP